MLKTKQRKRKQISDLKMDLEIINPIESKSLFGGCNYCNNGYSSSTGWPCQFGSNSSSAGSGIGYYDNSNHILNGGYLSDWNNHGTSSSGGGGGGGVSYWVDNNGDGINDADQTQDPQEWGLLDFFDHYNNGNGQAVTLDQMCLRDDVIASNVYLEIMTNVNNQIEALVHAQVAQGNNQPGTYQFTWDFNNTYDFTLAPDLFALGGSVLGGKFSGVYTLDANCNINVNGTLNVNFHTTFEDPWDIVNAAPGSWDPTGIPYSIDDTWQQEILMQNIKP
jgi:hypothetical protein